MADTIDQTKIQALSDRAEKLPTANPIRNPIRDDVAALRRDTLSTTPPADIAARLANLESRLTEAEKSADSGKLNIDDEKNKIKKALVDLAPDKIESSLLSTEKLLQLCPEQYKTLLRGYTGSLILEKFEGYGQRIILKSGNKIEVTPIDQTHSTQTLLDNNDLLRLKLQALLESKRLDVDILKIGMLYRAQSFVDYSIAVRGETGKVMNPETEKDPVKYFNYLKDKQKQGAKLSPAEETLMASQESFKDAQFMVQAIEQVKDLGQIQKAAESFNQTSPMSGNNVPSAVGGTVGVIGGGLGKLAGASGAGAINVFTDMLSSATKEGGAMGGLVVIGGLIAAIWKFGFWKTMAGMLGVGLASEAAAGRVDLKGEMGKLEKAGASVAATVGDLTDKAEGLVGDKTEGEKPTEKPKLSTSQDKAVKKVNSNTDFVQALNEQAENNAKSTNEAQKKKTGKIEHYLDFINIKLQNQKLENLFYSQDIESSIFSNSTSFSLKGIDIPENLDRSFLKQVLRLYITGQYKFTTPVQGAKQGQKEREEFLKDKSAEKYKDKTLADILTELNQ